MKQIVFFALFLFSSEAHSQRRQVTITPENFIGTWTLTKLADKHLNYRSDSVRKEFLRFIKDSVFISIENKRYAGTWSLVGGQPIIKIKETDQFNYTWIAGDVDSKFFTTKGLGYYKYFVRTSKD